MKTPSLHSLAVLFFLAAIGHCYSQDKPFVPPATARQTFDFNVGWKFLRSDGKAVDVCKVRTGFHKAEYKGGAGKGGVWLKRFVEKNLSS